jgi:hypothetical protein
MPNSTEGLEPGKARTAQFLKSTASFARFALRVSVKPVITFRPRLLAALAAETGIGNPEGTPDRCEVFMGPRLADAGK